MANQKSQIYPIQLQDVELNLNKFDGEIKQYSGFNKNNSPFVGGCLSNIFTKDETIEGATSENTYIAPNGDVYKLVVNNNGVDFCLNDTVLKHYSDLKNWKKRESFFSDDLQYIAMVDDKFFCYVSTTESETHNNFYVKFFNEYTKTWETFQLDIFSGSKTVTAMTIDIKRNVTNDGTTYLIAYKQETRYSSGSWGIIVYYRSETVNFDNVKKNHNFSVPSNVTFSLWNVITHFGTNGEIFVFPNAFYFNNNSPKFCYKYTYNPLAASQANILTNETALTESDIVIDTTDVVLAKGQNYSNIAECYRFTQNNIYFVTFPTYYETKSNTYVITGSYRYNPSSHKIIITPTGTLPKTTSVQSVEYDFITKHGVLGSYLTANEQYTICDEMVPGVTFDDEGTPHAYIGCTTGKYLLCNNGTITGVCGGDKDYPFLLSDWNEIKEVLFTKSGFSSQDNNDTPNLLVIYKDNEDRFTKISNATTDELTITKNNSLLVLNCCERDNSYDVERKVFLNFGLGWNNRFVRPSGTITYSSDAKNLVYYATSINEYKSENNSSLLLNPIPISISFDYTGSITSHFLKDLKNLINIYIGSEGEVYYKCSYDHFLNFILDKDLEGLPFPIDTNGNVQYSASLLSQIKSFYGNDIFIKSGNTYYPLMKNNNKAVMSFYLAAGIDNLEEGFIIQGQFYGIINNGIYSIQYQNGVVSNISFIVDCTGLQFVGNTPYEALFFSKVNRCLYSFIGSNVLNHKQFIDKINEVRDYLYNPATQSIFLITDIGVIVYSLFGIYQIEFLNCYGMYLLNNGVILTNNEGIFKYVKYYKEETTDDYTKENIQLETMFYGMNNQTVTINDCLYMRIFSEEHEEGDLEVSATTLSLEGRMTEKTTFKIKASDWDEITHTIYLRYQPKEQRGLGISFSINSPFKIASLSVGSQADAILVDKVSKGAINAPQRTSNNDEW